ncbi:MAG: arginine--tRNA ligase [Chitinophagales bacterium]
MSIEKILIKESKAALKSLYDSEVNEKQIQLQKTRPEFKGDLTLVVFPFLKISKKNPEETASEIGNHLIEKSLLVKDFNVIKGFLNLEIAERYWLDFFRNEIYNPKFGAADTTGQKIVVEYCGPNTNKPLHLGHIRNMLLGYATANILEMAGNEVHKVNIYNDRGIAICKSMLAWQKFGNGETPESSGMKGDHLVGKYYVEFDKAYKKQIEELKANGATEEEAKKQAPLIKEAQEMLVKWENEDPETVALWNKMNGWVYAGFQKTFDKLGVDFEKHYKESDYYLAGKNLVNEGLKKDIFYKKENGSVWVDLQNEGLDEKLLLRADGTSVYITQDMGIAEARYQDFNFDRSVYVVANEQDYHFKVLKLVLAKLGKPYAEGIFHLSYGMVDLPSGKMKSREGTVVDADDLIQEMIDTAAHHTKELGKIEGFSDDEAQDLFRKIGLGALKYFMLRVDPKKRMLFNPEESIDFHGNTGPFVQYTHARIQSVLRKSSAKNPTIPENYAMHEIEREHIKLLHDFPGVIQSAADEMNPAALAAFAYDLAKSYNRLYAECPILKAEAQEQKAFRLALSKFTADIIAKTFKVLGIEVPDKM